MQTNEMIKSNIEQGLTTLGIEFGSTRIKAVLVDEDRKPIASGAHDWENRLENGVWTYTLDDIWTGLQDCYKKMAEDVMEQYGVKVEKLAGIGFSAMMHGYLAFDKDGNLLPDEVRLTPFGEKLRSTSLDELPEFQRYVLDSLRHPIEEHQVQISRNGGNMVYP